MRDCPENIHPKLPGQHAVVGLPLPVLVVQIELAIFHACYLPVEVRAGAVEVQRLHRTVENPLSTRDTALLGIELEPVIDLRIVPAVSSVPVICVSTAERGAIESLSHPDSKNKPEPTNTSQTKGAYHHSNHLDIPNQITNSSHISRSTHIPNSDISTKL